MAYRKYIQSPTVWVVVIVGLLLLTSSLGTFTLPPEFYTYGTLHPIRGAVLLAILMFIASVCAPIALLPLIPVVAAILGPFTTAVACSVGWVSGALTAFLIGRYGGRPLLGRLTDLRVIEKYEARIPADSYFLMITAIRFALPTDVLSYAFGIFTRVSPLIYTLASAVSIVWYSFLFAYLGSTIQSGDTVLFTIYGVVSALIFVFSLIYASRKIRATGDPK